jgi:hypothetical protein
LRRFALILAVAACKTDVAILDREDTDPVDTDVPDTAVDTDDTDSDDTDSGDTDSGDTDSGDTAAPADVDSDGALDDVDCDDLDGAVFPGAPETCDDDVDQDCRPDTECDRMCATEVVFAGACADQPAWSGPAPALWWRFDAGPTPTDASGHDRHGAVTGVFSATDGQQGGGAALDGTAHASADVSTPGAFTWAQWVRVDALPTQDFAMLANLGNGTTMFTGWAVTVDRQGRFGAYVEGGTRPLETVLTAAEPLCVGAWAHVAVTWSAGTLRLYVDGAEVASKTTSFTTIPYGGLPLHVGWDANQQRRPVTGAYDEALLVQDALTAAQIAELYALALCDRGPG